MRHSSSPVYVTRGGYKYINNNNTSMIMGIEVRQRRRRTTIVQLKISQVEAFPQDIKS